MIMESYYDKWLEETDGKAGAKKGFTTTAGKRQKDFQKYVGMVGESRETTNAELWSERLMDTAHKELMGKTKIDQSVDTGESDENSANEKETKEKKKDRVYLKYASKGLGDISSEEEDDDDDSETVTVNTAMRRQPLLV